MEYIDKQKIGLIFLMIIFSWTSCFAQIDYSLPKDAPALEALIALHKIMKKKEQESLSQLSAVTGSQEITTSFTKKISDVQTTIYNKMNDVNSYIILATTITDVSMKLADLAKEVATFETEMGALVLKKPFVAKHYIAVQRNIKTTVEKLYTSILSFTAQGLNIFVASNDEKLKLLYLIDSSINDLRYSIRNATLYMKYTNGKGGLMATMDELVSKNARMKISTQLIYKWKNSKGL